LKLQLPKAHYVDLEVTVAVALKGELGAIGRDGWLVVTLGTCGQALAIAAIQIDLKDI
jgi:hypothetical protein